MSEKCVYINVGAIAGASSIFAALRNYVSKYSVPETKDMLHIYSYIDKHK